jgi:hypothetical protein
MQFEMTNNVDTSLLMPPKIMVHEGKITYSGVLGGVYSFDFVMWPVMAGATRRSRVRSASTFWVCEIWSQGGRPNVKNNTTTQSGALSAAIEWLRLCWHHDPEQRPVSFDEIQWWSCLRVVALVVVCGALALAKTA